MVATEAGKLFDARVSTTRVNYDTVRSIIQTRTVPIHRESSLNPERIQSSTSAVPAVFRIQSKCSTSIRPAQYKYQASMRLVKCQHSTSVVPVQFSCLCISSIVVVRYQYCASVTLCSALVLHWQRVDLRGCVARKPTNHVPEDIEDKSEKLFRHSAATKKKTKKTKKTNNTKKMKQQEDERRRRR